MKLLKILLTPFNMLYKMMMKPMGAMFGIMLFVIVMLIIVAMKQGGMKENFSKLKRYMYMFNPPSTNSSYDTRGDNLAIKKPSPGPITKFLHDQYLNLIDEISN